MKNSDSQSCFPSTYLEEDTADQYSFDWRFLPDLPCDGKVLIVVDSPESMCFHSCCQVSQKKQNRVDQAPTEKKSNPWQQYTAVRHADFLQNTASKEQFDIIVIPHGIPSSKDKHGDHLQYAYGRVAYRLTKSGGFFCMGFANRWNLHRAWRKATQGEMSFSPRGISRVLTSSEYKSVSLYGAIPNHKTSRYIFPLQTNTIRFVVQQHYGSKIPVLLSPLVPSYLISFVYRYLLPSYWIVASKKA